MSSQAESPDIFPEHDKEDSAFENVNTAGDGLKTAEAFGRRLRNFRYTADDEDKSTPDRVQDSLQSKIKATKRTNASSLDKSAPEPSPSKDRRRPLQTSLTGYPSPNKKQRIGSPKGKRNGPSQYAHLPELNDVMAPNLILLFIGLNPGITTAEQGHAYAHPSNLFWKLLYASGCTDRRCAPQEDVDMPELYGMGFTNIVSRPTRDGSQLTKAEMVAGTPILEEKARKWRPEACCLVGKSIWEAVFKWKQGRTLKKDEFHYGWQDDSHNLGRDKGWAGCKVFVAASTSGLSASLLPAEKEAIWKPLGEWVKQRRQERAATADSKPG